MVKAAWDGEVQKLLGAVALCTALSPNTFARIGAVVNLKVEDYYPSGKRLICRCMAQFG
jgi:hypothetical protein